MSRSNVRASEIVFSGEPYALWDLLTVVALGVLILVDLALVCW